MTEDPRYEEALALARRLNRAMHGTRDIDQRAMLARQAELILSKGYHLPKITWRNRLQERLWVLREKLALWIAPWLDSCGRGW